MDARLTTSPYPQEEIRLLIKLYRKREKGLLLSLGDPFPEEPIHKPPPRKNIVAEAVRFHKFHEENSGLTYEAIGQHFGVTRARVSQLIGLVEHLPEDFITRLKNSTDQDFIKSFPYRVLFKISKLPLLKEQREMIRKSQADHKQILRNLKKSSDTRVFEAEEVFKYFKKSEDFEWIEKTNVLTRRLKRVKVSSEQRRINGEKKRVYILNVRVLSDLCERFKI